MESSTVTAVGVELPDIAEDEQFVSVVKKLSVYVTASFTQPATFEQLRTTSYGNSIRSLVDHLVENCTNPAIVNAILTVKFHFSSLDPDDRGLNETRANACEIVAWRFLSRLSERDAIQYALYELPSPDDSSSDESVASSSVEQSRTHRRSTSSSHDRSPLLPQFRSNENNHGRPVTPRAGTNRRQQLLRSVTESHIFAAESDDGDDEDEKDPTSAFTGLSALEIAAVANAKRFLSQRLVQKIIYGLWKGEIVLWDGLEVHSTKKVQFYNKRTADPFSRLRVPKYIKIFESIFFLIFLAIYYAVLMERNPYHITFLECLLYIWLFAFTYDELSEFIDAGLFYYADFWSTWDLAIILNGLAFLVTRIAGLVLDDNDLTEIAFDILSLEALFLVPRSFSMLSLHPYFGTLIPCLKEMAKDFLKFMSVVLILYLGFFTTFILLARNTIPVEQLSWVLLKVFFGASYIGFDIMYKISPQLGPPLMIIFVILTNILLITSLISLLSNSFSRVISHAREEYLYVYSVYVLEASTSNRLTHFYPPFNLIPLILIRPLRLFCGPETLRRLRIALLKGTHAPIVASIWAYETSTEWWWGKPEGTFSRIGPSMVDTPKVIKAPGMLSSRFNRAEGSYHYTGPASLGTPTRRRNNARGTGSGTLYGAGDGMGESSEHVGPDLEARVEELSQKIAELTSLLMVQGARAAE